MNSKKTQYKILSVLMILMLTMPLIQMHIHLFHVKKLKGWFIEYKKPDFFANNWFSGKFQEAYNNYFENNFGFRPWFVRLRNQTSFSVSGRAKAAGVIVGKDLYLYEENYIRAYNGLDFLGYDFINSQVDSIVRIRDSLLYYNTDLVICLAAGKGSFYPEYFPEEYFGQRSDSTNYIFYRNLLNKQKINLVDFNAWFLEMKDTSRFILYTKYGIHWSEYGALLAADSLIRYIEKLKSVDVPDMVFNTIELSNKPKGSDYDMGESLNLLFRLYNEEMAYPKITWQTDKKDTVKVIVISDSFYWQLFNQGVGTIAFKPGGFWYYNKVSYPGNIEINNINYLENLKSADVIILLATEATLDRFPFGFLKDCYNVFNLTTD